MNAKEPAFPSLHTIDGNWQKGPLKELQGLTKREYFAAIATQGIISNNAYRGVKIENAVRDAILVADELLKQLEQ